MFEYLKTALTNMVAILMISAKLATLGLLKIKVFQNKGYDATIFDASNSNVCKKTSQIKLKYIGWRFTVPCTLYLARRQTQWHLKLKVLSNCLCEC